jgi:hypothetical protein
MIRRLSAALAVAAAMAGCGGPGAEESFIKDHLRPIQLLVEQEKAQLSAQLQVVRLGRERDAATIGSLVDQLERSVNTMGHLSAPASLESLFHRYVIAHRHLVAALRRFGRLLAGHSESALNREADSAQRAAGEIARARDALDERISAALKAS